MIKGSKAHSKEVEKHRDFSDGLLLMGGLPRLQILKNKEFSTAISIFGHFKWAFHLMDSVGIFSYEICKTHRPMSQILDDMHASLPDLKYRPPFLLSLLVA
jgi:hypothetical protein